MSLGSGLAARVGAEIARLGQPVVFRGGYLFGAGTPGSGVTVSALVEILPAGARTEMFRSVETKDWIAPAYAVTIAGDGSAADSPLIGDAVSIAGVLYALFKIVPTRVGVIAVKTTYYAANKTAAAPVGAAGASVIVSTPEDLTW